MIKHWTKFEGCPYGAERDQARVTLNKKKVFLLNPPAYNALGDPAAVEMLFDEARKVIGLKPTDPQRRNAFRLKPKKGGRFKVITASAFCTHFGIEVERTVLFEHVNMDSEGVLMLDMAKTINVGRGSR